MLIVFSGLPGTGKTTIARDSAARTRVASSLHSASYVSANVEWWSVSADTFAICEFNARR
jgi:tRNA uridine 5-carbamoylmethylation protein Kti12